MIKMNRIPLFFASIALASLMGGAATAKHESSAEHVDDTVIITKLKTAIFNEPALKSGEINVETFKGRVQLSGFVNSQSDINQAITLAQNVGGVKSVAHDMRLK